MKRAIVLFTFLLTPACAFAQSLTPIVVSACGAQTYHAGQSYPMTMDTTGTLCAAGSGGGASSVNVTSVNGVALGAPSAYGTSPGAVVVPGVNAFVTNSVTSVTSGAITNPTSTLTSGTATAITATNNEIASSTTAGSIVVPSFAIATSAGGAIIPKLTMQTSATSGWGGASIQIDLWRAAPMLTNGDGAVYLPATGSASYIGSYTCTLAQAGDGAYGECTPNAGQADFPKLASGANVYWTAFSLSTVTKGSGQTFVLTAAVLN